MIHELQTIDDPRLDIFRDLRGNSLAVTEGLFIAEGPTVVERLFESEYQVRSLMINDAKWNRFKDRIPEGADVFRVSNALASELVGYSFHAGILAAGIRKPSPRLTAVCEACAAAKNRILIVAAIEVIDRQNVGAIIRGAAAFGADAVAFGPRCSDPFSRRSLRVSMGNGFYMPVCQSDDLQNELQDIREEYGVRLFATALDADSITLDKVEKPGRCALLFGNESHGLSEEWKSFCDQRVSIPMRGRTDSLNVGFATGIFLYEFTRDESA